MTLKRQRLTCSCGVNACGEVPRRRINTAHLRSTPPRQCFQGSCGVSAAGTVRRCTAVHLITSSLRKEVNEAVCWSERKTAGTQRKLLYLLMSRKLGSSLKDIGGKKNYLYYFARPRNYFFIFKAVFKNKYCFPGQ